MKVAAAAPLKAWAGKGQGRQQKFVICVLALFTAAQLISFVSLPGSHNSVAEAADDEVECDGAALGTDRCYEARIFREWHSSVAETAEDQPPKAPAPEGVSEPIPKTALANEAPGANVNEMVIWRLVNQVADEWANQSDTRRERMRKNAEAHSIEHGTAVDRASGEARDLQNGDADNTPKEVTRESGEGPAETYQAESAWRDGIQTLEEAALSNEAHLSEGTAAVASMQARLRADVPTQTRLPATSTHTSEGTADLAAGQGQIADVRSSVQQSGVDAPSASRYERHHNLHWRHVQSWQSAAKSATLRGSVRSQAVTMLTKPEIRHSKWGGMIPTVACVAVVPYGKDITHRLMYFVDNFQLQNYEGAKQLVLVHHHDDLAAKTALSKYNNGVTVKVVAARMGDKHDDVSTLFRFGAWAAKDADVIARWDLHAWHDPSRLSMQIRAMALAHRPACRLTSWTMRGAGEGGNVSENSEVNDLGETSLVGEKEWMAQHWYPESESLSKAHSKHTVQLDFSELLVYHALS